MPFLSTYIDVRTVNFSPPPESWLVNSNFPRASRMQGVWTENSWCIFRMKSPFSNSSGIVRRGSHFLYVIAWTRGQLRTNFTSIFKVFTKLAESRSDEGNIWKTLKIRVKLILNCTRALTITCLSHAGQNFVHKTTFKVLPSRKQVCRLALRTG